MSEIINTDKKIVGQINQEELSSLNLRRNIIGNKNLIVNLLQRELDTYLMLLQSRHKLDKTKDYTIDNEGKIIEIQKK